MLVFCIAFVQNSFCQGNKLAKLDSLHQKFAKDSAYIHRVKKISPLFALDSRHSFIRNSTSKVAVDFQGFQLGVTLN